MEQDGLYKLLNNQWKTTCRILFGFEVGNLDEYKEWLTELNNPKLVKTIPKFEYDKARVTREFLHEPNRLVLCQPVTIVLEYLRGFADRSVAERVEESCHKECGKDSE